MRSRQNCIGSGCVVQVDENRAVYEKCVCVLYMWRNVRSSRQNCIRSVCVYRWRKVRSRQNCIGSVCIAQVEEREVITTELNRKCVLYRWMRTERYMRNVCVCCTCRGGQGQDRTVSEVCVSTG